jgi:hypothetical protein
VRPSSLHVLEVVFLSVLAALLVVLAEQRLDERQVDDGLLLADGVFEDLSQGLQELSRVAFRSVADDFDDLLGERVERVGRFLAVRAVFLQIEGGQGLRISIGTSGDLLTAGSVSDSGWPQTRSQRCFTPASTPGGSPGRRARKRNGPLAGCRQRALNKRTTSGKPRYAAEAVRDGPCGAACLGFEDQGPHQRCKHSQGREPGSP